MATSVASSSVLHPWEQDVTRPHQQYEHATCERCALCARASGPRASCALCSVRLASAEFAAVGSLIFAGESGVQSVATSWTPNEARPSSSRPPCHVGEALARETLGSAALPMERRELPSAIAEQGPQRDAPHSIAAAVIAPPSSIPPPTATSFPDAAELFFANPRTLFSGYAVSKRGRGAWRPQR